MERVRAHPARTVIVVVGLVTLAFVVFLWLKPLTLEASFIPDPAGSYEEAVERIETRQAAELARGDLNDVCTSKLIGHGEKTEKVVVFFHGFTSCPEQYMPLGQEFFDRGYNVYIPLQPHHGVKDLMTEELAQLTAEELAAYGSDAVDIAQGLGETVTVSGLSGGGSVTTWLAQERGDIALAAPAAAFLGIDFIPAFATKPLTNLALMLPNFYMWWDPATKNDNPGASDWQYRRYATHALMANLKLGFAAQADAVARPPAASEILLISNAGDRSVSQPIIDKMAGLWRAELPDQVQTYQFEKAMGLEHDIISVDRDYSRPDIVYPILLDLLGAGETE